MSDAESVIVPPASQPRLFAKWPGLRKSANILLLVLCAAAIAGQVFVWMIWDPAFGDSLKNLITYAMVILMGFLVTGWWFLFAPFSWRTVLLVGVPVVVLVFGLYMSIRRVDMSGDMRASIEFVWQPSREDRLAEHLKQTAGKLTSQLDAVPEITAEDMPGYRGADRMGIVTGPPLSQNWDQSPPPELWRHPVGGGYAQFAVVGNQLITIEQRGENEAIVCYDAQSGLERWIHAYPAHFQEAAGGPGPRSTPTIDGDAVFVVGALGDIHCLGLLKGDVRWHVNVLEAYHMINTDWAMTSSPLVVGTKVIVNPGGPDGNGLVALHRETGAIIWAGDGISDVTGTPSRNRPGYACPTLVDLLGVQQILNFDGTALRGHDPETGEQLWSFPYENGAGVNAAQPILLGDGKIFISASYDVGAALIEVSHTNGQWSAQQLWQNINLRSKFSTAHLIGGYLYGLDEGIMVCVDPNTGERMWKGGREGLKGRYGHGQQLLTNDQLVLLTEAGDLVLINPSPERLIEVTHFKVLPEGKVWNPLALSRGRAYVRNAIEMAAFDLRAERTQAPVAAATPVVSE